LRTWRIPASNSTERSVKEKLAYTTLRVASSRKLIRIARRFPPLPSGTGKPTRSSACTHSRGEKKSNFRLFSSRCCSIRLLRSSPDARTNRDSEEEETEERITPCL
jgi:hypothetical protein